MLMICKKMNLERAKCLLVILHTSRATASIVLVVILLTFVVFQIDLLETEIKSLAEDSKVY